MYFVWKALSDFINAKIPVGVLTFLMVAFLLFLQPLHYALAEGIIPYFHSGYCKADVGCPANQTIAMEITDIRTTLASMERSRLRGEIRLNHRLWCSTDNAEDKFRYQEYIDVYQEEYALINEGNQYPLSPTCQS